MQRPILWGIIIAVIIMIMLPMPAMGQDSLELGDNVSVQVSRGAELYCGRPITDYNVIDGNAGDDALAGTDRDDLIRGYGGVDRIRGGAGNDCLMAGDGNDFVFGQTGNDVIYGGSGNDRLSGRAGSECRLWDRTR